MGELALSFAVSILLGFLSGLGVGGGSLLILWLTAALQMEAQQARLINLMFFIPSALISALFHWKQGRLKWQVILPALAAGCAAAWMVSRLDMDPGSLKKFFGGFLILTGLRELLYKDRKVPHQNP